MSKVVVHENEDLEEALKRFKRNVNRAGTQAAVKKKAYYIKPGAKKKLKSKEARKKNKKKRFN